MKSRNSNHSAARRTPAKKSVPAKKICPLTGAHAPKIDYKDTELLRKFTSEGGRILPARITGVSHKKQRELARAIKRSRLLSLIPFVAE